MDALRGAHQRYADCLGRFAGRKGAEGANEKFLREVQVRARRRVAAQLDRSADPSPIPLRRSAEPFPLLARPLTSESATAWAEALKEGSAILQVQATCPHLVEGGAHDLYASTTAVGHVAATLAQEPRSWAYVGISEAVAVSRARVVAAARRALQQGWVALPRAADDLAAVHREIMPLSSISQGPTATHPSAVRGDWLLARADARLRGAGAVPLLIRPAERVLEGSKEVVRWTARVRAGVATVGADAGFDVRAGETDLMMLRRVDAVAARRVEESMRTLRPAAYSPRSTGAAAPVLAGGRARLVALWHAEDSPEGIAGLFSPLDAESGPGKDGLGRSRAGPLSPEEEGALGGGPRVAIDTAGNVVRVSPHELLRRIARGDGTLRAGAVLRQVLAAESLEDLTLMRDAREAGEAGGGGEAQGVAVTGALARIRAEMEARERGHGPLARNAPEVDLPPGGAPTSALPTASSCRLLQRAWRLCATVRLRSDLVRCLRALSAAEAALAQLAGLGHALSAAGASAAAGASPGPGEAMLHAAAAVAAWPRAAADTATEGFWCSSPTAGDAVSLLDGGCRLADAGGFECVASTAHAQLAAVAAAVEASATALCSDVEARARSILQERGDGALEHLGFSAPEDVAADTVAALLLVMAGAADALEGRASLLVAVARTARACADAGAIKELFSWAADAAPLPFAGLDSARGLAASAAAAAAAHYAAAALDECRLAVAREAALAAPTAAVLGALSLDAAAVRCCRAAALPESGLLGLAPRVTMRLEPLLRARLSRVMSAALAAAREEDETGLVTAMAAAAPPPPQAMLRRLSAGVVGLRKAPSAGPAPAPATHSDPLGVLTAGSSLVEVVPGTTLDACLARARASPADPVADEGLLRRACAAAVRGTQLAAADAAWHEVEGTLGALMVAKGASLFPRASPRAQAGGAVPPSPQAGALPPTSPPAGSKAPLQSLLLKCGALNDAEALALAQASRSLLRLATAVSEMGARLLAAGHAPTDAFDALNSICAHVKQGAKAVAAAVAAVPVTDGGERGTRGGAGGDGPSLPEVAERLGRAERATAGAQERMVAVAAARRTLADSALLGLELQGCAVDGSGGDAGAQAVGEEEAGRHFAGGTAGLPIPRAPDSARTLWPASRPPAGLAASTVVHAATTSVGGVPLFRSIPTLRDAMAEEGSGANKGRTWVEAAPLLHVAALVDAAKGQGGNETTCAQLSATVDVVLRAHDTLREDAAVLEWLRRYGAFARAAWGVALDQAYRTAASASMDAGVACCQRAAAHARRFGGADLVHASASLLASAPAACKVAFLQMLARFGGRFGSLSAAELRTADGRREFEDAQARAGAALRVLRLRSLGVQCLGQLSITKSLLRGAPHAVQSAVAALADGAPPSLAPHVAATAHVAAGAASEAFGRLFLEYAKRRPLPVPRALVLGSGAGALPSAEEALAVSDALEEALSDVAVDLLLRIEARELEGRALALFRASSETTEAPGVRHAVRSADDILQSTMKNVERICTVVDAETGQVTELEILVQDALAGFRDDVFTALATARAAEQVQLGLLRSKIDEKQQIIRKLRARAAVSAALLRRPLNVPQLEALEDPLEVLRLIEVHQSERRAMRVQLGDAFARGRLEAIMEMQDAVLQTQSQAMQANMTVAEMQTGMQKEVATHVNRLRQLRNDALGDAGRRDADEPDLHVVGGPALERAVLDAASAAAEEALRRAEPRASSRGGANRPEVVAAAAAVVRRALEQREKRAAAALQRAAALERQLQAQRDSFTDARVAMRTSTAGEHRDHARILAAKDTEIAELRNKWQQAEAEHEQNLIQSKELHDLRVRLRTKTAQALQLEEQRDALKREVKLLRREVVELKGRHDLEANRASALREGMRSLHAQYVSRDAGIPHDAAGRAPSTHSPTRMRPRSEAPPRAANARRPTAARAKQAYDRDSDPLARKPLPTPTRPQTEQRARLVSQPPADSARRLVRPGASYGRR